MVKGGGSIASAVGAEATPTVFNRLPKLSLSDLLRETGEVGH